MSITYRIRRQALHVVAKALGFHIKLDDLPLGAEYRGPWESYPN